MAAVDEYGELDLCRPSVGEQGVDRCAHSAPGKKDVIDDHDDRPVEREVELRPGDDRRVGTQAEVVAVKGDVERAERELGVEDLLEEGRQPPRERYAATVDPNDRDATLGRRVALGDLVRDPPQRSRDVVPLEDDRFGYVNQFPQSFQASLDRVKGAGGHCSTAF
jgi:hypothetical protein